MRTPIYLPALLMLAACGAEPEDVSIDETETADHGEMRLITYGSDEWYAIPWCTRARNGDVLPLVAARQPLPIRSYIKTVFPLVVGKYYAADAAYFNWGFDACGLDIEWKYWARGRSTSLSPTTTVARSYIANYPGELDGISAPKVGNCVPGDGGTLVLSVRPTPGMLMQEPDGNSYPLEIFYSCN